MIMEARKYIKSSAIKVARLARLMAKAIDLFIVIVLSFFFYPIGLVIGILYLAVSDSIQGGQSVGKKFIGFSVISLEDAMPCSLKQSVLRNLPILLPLLFGLIPFWGWIISLLIGAPLVILEIYLLYRLDSGHRLGDVMADTSVMANDSGIPIKNRRTSWFAPETSRT